MPKLGKTLPLKPPPANWKPELETEVRDHEWRYIAGKNTDGSDKASIVHSNARKRIQDKANVALITSKSARERSHEEHVFLKNRTVEKKEARNKYRAANKEKISLSSKVYEAKYTAKYPGRRAAICKRWADAQGVVKNRERGRVYREKNHDKICSANRAYRCKRSNKWHAEWGQS
jgi:hypothetical protein